MARGDIIDTISATIDSPGVKLALPRHPPVGTRNVQTGRVVLLYFNGDNSNPFFITDAPGSTNGIRVPSGAIFEYEKDLAGDDVHLYAAGADTVTCNVLEI